MRVGLTYVMVLSFNLFTMTYFRMKQLFPLMDKLSFGAVCNWGVILHAAAYLANYQSVFVRISPLLLLILYVIIIMSIVFALITAFRLCTA